MDKSTKPLKDPINDQIFPFLRRLLMEKSTELLNDPITARTFAFINWRNHIPSEARINDVVSVVFTPEKITSLVDKVEEACDQLYLDPIEGYVMLGEYMSLELSTIDIPLKYPLKKVYEKERAEAIGRVTDPTGDNKRPFTTLIVIPKDQIDGCTIVKGLVQDNRVVATALYQMGSETKLKDSSGASPESLEAYLFFKEYLRDTDFQKYEYTFAIVYGGPKKAEPRLLALHPTNPNVILINRMEPEYKYKGSKPYKVTIPVSPGWVK